MRMGITRQGEARSELRSALELDAKQARVRTTLATLENAQGNPKAAAEQLRAAYELSPTEPTVLYQLAMLYKREGKTEEAERLMSAFREAKKKAGNEENEPLLILKTVKP